MKKYSIIILVVIAIIAIALIANSNGSKQASGETIKIGFVSPLTGDVASLGIAAKYAFEIAVDEINTSGGIDGKQIQTFIEDTKCDPKAGTDGGRKLIEFDKVNAIVGGLCSGETLAIAPIAEANKVVLISHGASNPSISNSGDYIFRDYPSDAFQGKIDAQYAYRNLGKKVAVVFTNADYTKGLEEVFTKTFKELGGTVVFSETVKQGERDLRTVITRLKAASPDFIYAPTYTGEAVALLKQLSEQNVTVPKLGADAWDDIAILKDSGAAAEGILWTAPDSPKATDAFLTKFKAKAGESGSVMAGTLQAYDAVKILEKAIKKVGTDPEKLKNEMYNTTLRGLSNPNIAFDKNGDLKESTYVLKKAVKGVGTVVETL